MGATNILSVWGQSRVLGLSLHQDFGFTLGSKTLWSMEDSTALFDEKAQLEHGEVVWFWLGPKRAAV